jgi:hypothetical protein
VDRDNAQCPGQRARLLRFRGARAAGRVFTAAACALCENKKLAAGAVKAVLEGTDRALIHVTQC